MTKETMSEVLFYHLTSQRLEVALPLLLAVLGRKTGRGFYDYRGETPVPTR